LGGGEDARAAIGVAKYELVELGVPAQRDDRRAVNGHLRDLLQSPRGDKGERRTALALFDRRASDQQVAARREVALCHCKDRGQRACADGVRRTCALSQHASAGQAATWRAVSGGRAGDAAGGRRGMRAARRAGSGAAARQAAGGRRRSERWRRGGTATRRAAAGRRIGGRTPLSERRIEASQVPQLHRAIGGARGDTVAILVPAHARDVRLCRMCATDQLPCLGLVRLQLDLWRRIARQHHLPYMEGGV
jgi:hypothetical protein